MPLPPPSNPFDQNDPTNPPGGFDTKSKILGGSTQSFVVALKKGAASLAATMSKLSKEEYAAAKDILNDPDSTPDQIAWANRLLELSISDDKSAKDFEKASKDPPQYNYNREIDIPDIMRSKMANGGDLMGLFNELTERNTVTSKLTLSLIDAMEKIQGADIMNENNWIVTHKLTACQCWSNIILNEFISFEIRQDIYKIIHCLRHFKN